jgi:hypothetical protein
LQIQSRVVAPDEVTFLGFTFRVRKDCDIRREIAPESIQLFEATPPSCRIGSPIALPVTASHTRAVLSAEAVTTRWPSGLNCADTTPPSCRIGSVTITGPTYLSQQRDCKCGSFIVSAVQPQGLCQITGTDHVQPKTSVKD